MADVLYIARHGETTWNAEGRVQGRMDSPLTATGVSQADALADAFAEKKTSTAFTAPPPDAPCEPRKLSAVASTTPLNPIPI